jgi:hypothetical protein
MPSLIVSYQKQQTVTQLKKAYSVLNQAAKLAGVDYGEFEFKGITLAGKTVFLEQYVLPYVKGVQTCIPLAECGIDLSDYRGLHGGGIDGAGRIDNVGVVLADGSVFIISNTNDSSTYYYPYIDINGVKGPNILGKDVFRLSVAGYTANGVEFFEQGAARDVLISKTDGGCNTSRMGKTCGALIMHDGWEIAPDYPW